MTDPGKTNSDHASSENENKAFDDNSLADRLDRLWTSGPLAVPSLQTEQRIGPYILQQVVGAGSFGVVYLARDTKLERAVAIKLPRLEVLLDADKRERFAAEAAMVAKLDHPGIVRVYEAQLDGPQPYIASAFCDGPNLAEWLAEQKHPSAWQAIAPMMADIAEAAQYAHSKDVLHRDLKPANILLVSPEDANDDLAEQHAENTFPFLPQLTDFGLAKFSNLETADTRSSQMIGTPLYMAPERLEGCQATAVADVYSLGVILFETLTGQMPIDGDNYLELLERIRRQSPQRLRTLRRDVPADLDRICSKCLEKEPKARYQTAADLANDLRRCVANQSIQGQLPNWWHRLSYWCARPERVANAGWYAIVSHLVLIAWMASAVMLLPLQFEMENVQWTKQIYEMLYGACFSFGPIIVFGLFVLRGHRWAIYIGFIVTLLKIPAQFRAMVFKPMYFADLYETGGVYVFMDHFIVAILLLFQLFFFGCAIAADLKRRRLQ